MKDPPYPAFTAEKAIGRSRVASFAQGLLSWPTLAGWGRYGKNGAGKWSGGRFSFRN